jgi:hypothetical protein
MRILASAIALFSLTLAQSSFGQEQLPVPPPVPDTSIVPSSPPAETPPRFQAFSDTELQVLGMFGPARAPNDGNEKASDGAFILTFQHFSTWELGYNFFFLDVESQPSWHFYDEKFGLYFEYAPVLSFNKLGLTELAPDGVINDIMLTLQLNLGYAVGGIEINRVFLEGLVLNWGVPGSPVFETHFLARQEHNYDLTWQFTFAWLVPFSFGEFRGFMDVWQTRANENPGTEDKLVLLSQPQLIFRLLDHLYAGAELELRHDFPGKFLYEEGQSTWDFRVGPMLMFNF